MKKIQKIILFLVLLIPFYNSYWNSWDIIVPKEINWTERFILNEIKDLRISYETLKRELFTELQKRELDTVDRALSYSANTVNFFFVFFTIIFMLFWVVWWKTIWDIKKSTKETIDKEAEKIISNFQNKIEELEKEQKVNILWRQFNVTDSDKDKMDILDKIFYIKPESEFATIERSNVYLSMWVYEKVIELTNLILASERTKHHPQALYNRACAFVSLWKNEDSLNDLTNLLNISPDYKDIVLESDYFKKIINKVLKIIK
jgi:hypothetical protein